MNGATTIGTAVTTGADGSFSFNNVPNGDYNLVVSKDNFTVTTTVTVLNENITLGAVVLYQILTVNGGAGSGNYSAGTVVTITEAIPAAGQRFTTWTVVGSGVTLAKATDVTTTFIMPGNTVAVTANYEAIPVTSISFDANSGLGDMAVQQISEGSPQALNENTFTRAGYSFTNWNTEKNGSGTAFDNSAQFSAATKIEKVTLYAQWTENTFTISGTVADGNTAAIAAATVELKKGDTVIGAAVTAAADGSFSFNQVRKGDYTLVVTKDGFTATTAVTVTNENISLEQAIILYQMLTVNGGAGSGHYAQGATVTIKANEPKTGVRFTNWTAPDGVTLADAKAPETTFTMPGKTVEISANYEAIPVTNINYDANSGAGTMALQQISEGTPQNLSANTFTCAGYSFKNWNTSADGKGTDYADGASFTASATTASVNLYAQWTLVAEPGYGVLRSDGKVYTTNADNTKTDGVEIDIATVDDTVTHLFAADEVDSIGDWAFIGCDVLTTVNMPRVTTIGEEAFNSCQALTSVEVPAVTLIGEGAFSMDDALIYINMAAVETINAGAFAHCEKLKTADMPVASSIGEGGFYTCVVLTTVNMPKVTSIGRGAFVNNRALTTVKMPEVTSIGDWAFANCGALTMVEMPKVTSIGEQEFSQCPLLSNLTVGATPPTVGADAFKDCKPTTLIIAGGNTPAAVAAYEAADISTPNGYWYGWALSYPLKVNDGTVSEATASGDYLTGATVTITAAIPAAGQRFTTWTVVGSGVTLAKATDVTTTFIMPGNAVAVTANYEAIPVTSISFDANSGLGDMAVQQINEGSPQALNENTFTRAGYRFAGWNTEKNGKGKTYADGESFKASTTKESITLYAQWTEKTNSGVTYRSHIQNKGWETTWAADGESAGTEGQSLRLEGIEINLTGENLPVGAHIEYRTHVQNIGWETNWTSDGQIAGTVGQSLRLEAIQIRLVDMPGYSVEYRTHVQNIGWETTWTADGESAGTEGQSLRLEAIEIRLVKTVVPDIENE